MNLSYIKIRLIFLTLFFNLKLLLRLICALGFYIVRTLIAHSPWAPGQLLSSNFYLDKSGRPNIGDNLIISFSVHGVINVEKLKQRIKQVWLDEGLYPQLQEEIVIWFGYPFWRKDLTFDLNEHFSTLFVELSDEIKYSELEYNFLREKFYLENKSPWKVGVFLDSKNDCSKVLFKFHHSLGDGISMYELLMSVADNYVQIQPPPLHRPLTSNVLRYLRPPGDFDLIKFFLDCGTICQFTIPRDKMSIERHIKKSDKISMQMLKSISARHGVPLTAVLLAGISGALHNFLSKAKGQGQIPKFIFCPIPIRLPGQQIRKGLTNNVEVIAIKLPIGEPNPYERVRLCKDSLEKCQTSQYSFLARLLGFIMNAYPVGWGSLGTTLQVVISSFPGPKDQISFLDGANVVTDMYFNRLCSQRFPLLLTTLSYNGDLRISMSADTSVFNTKESVELFNELIQDEFNELKFNKIEYS